MATFKGWNSAFHERPMVRSPRQIAVLALVCAWSACAQDADTGRVRLWKAREWGTESQFGPASLLLNEGWDICQFRGNDRRLSRVWAPENWRRLGGALSHPLESVRRQGLGEFILTEFVPSSLAPSRAQWLPNFQLHLLGGGYNSARLEDWYAANGYAHPGALAAGTTMGAAVLNEVAELQGTSTQRSTDPLPDLLFFDPLGILIFRSDAVRGFFSRDVEMMNWPLQPTLAWPDGRAENAGQSWCLKVRTPFDGWKAFYHWGLGESFGLSRALGGSGLAVTAAGGLGAVRMSTAPDGGRTVEIAPKLGLYLDRENSLLATLQYHHGNADEFVLEVHPGSGSAWPVPVGFWLHAGGESGLGLGVVGRWGLGLGVVRGERTGER